MALTRDAAFGRPGVELVGDLGLRILELIDFGLSESFIVRALRDEFGLMIDAGADVGLSTPSGRRLEPRSWRCWPIRIDSGPGARNAGLGATRLGGQTSRSQLRPTASRRQTTLGTLGT